MDALILQDDDTILLWQEDHIQFVLWNPLVSTCHFTFDFILGSRTRSEIVMRDEQLHWQQEMQVEI